MDPNGLPMFLTQSLPLRSEDFLVPQRGATPSWSELRCSPGCLTLVGLPTTYALSLSVSYISLSKCMTVETGVPGEKPLQSRN